MKRIHTLAVLLFLSLLAWGADPNTVSLKDLQVEYEKNPLGIDVEKPRFSWRMEVNTDKRGFKQTAYRILVTDEHGRTVWDTDRVKSSHSLNIEYDGSPLQPATGYNWKLFVWDQRGEVATGTSYFETGLMAPTLPNNAWEGACWIGGGNRDMVLYAPYLPVFRLHCTLQLDEESGSTVAGFIYGANDGRLTDANKNLFGLAAAKDSSYIKVVLDTSPLAQGKTASLHVYRTGYCPTDKADVPFATFSIPPTLVNADNRYQPHTIRLSSNLGFTQFYIDQAEKPLGEVNLNPLGQGGDFIAFPVLADVGLFLPAGQAVKETAVEVRNFRSPANTLTTLQFDARKAEADAPFLQTYTLPNPATPMLRTTFTPMGSNIAKARLYVTARGIYDVYLNGRRVGEDYFNPGATQYNKTQLYQTFDVTSLIHQQGQNALGAVLAEGWWSGGATYTGENWNFFGDRQSLLAKLVITYTDGSRQVIVTHPDTWKYYGDGPVRYGSFFQGEVYDARREADVKGWCTPDYNDARWKPAREVTLKGHVSTEGNADMPRVDDYSQWTLTGQTGPTVKEVERLTARSVEEVRPGVFVYDMGQNMAGVPFIRFKGLKPGTEVRMRFAEVTYPDLPAYTEQKGMLMLENIRAAMAQDIYIAKGDNEETFSPRFTLHGYRYVELTGIDHPLPPADVQGIVLSSIHRFTSHYETSNEKVNQLWRNITWSARANFISIPTDCPQRNERLGWAGDISVFSPTATYLAEVPQFLRRYVQSMRDVQRPDGRFPDIAPMGGGFGGILWGSAGITVPWACYRHFADKALLADNYDAMKQYILYIAEKTIDPSTNLIVQNRAWGDLADWLGPEDGKNDKSLLWEAYFIHDLDIMSRTATVLGKHDDAHWYAQMRDARKDFFCRTYLQPLTYHTTFSEFEPSKEGQLVDTQTSYALTLAFGIADSILQTRIADNLANTLKRENIADDGTHCPPYTLMTGFIGTAWISQALSDNGYPELAYRLLQQTEYPSWLYSVEQGATTIWERLNSYTHTNGFGGNNRMNSFNHYSFGSVGAWMMGNSLGIGCDESEPAFKRILLNPEPDPTGQMKWAQGYYDSLYGRISSSWKITDEAVHYSFTIPANTTALLTLPDTSPKQVREGGKLLLRTVRGIKLKSRKDGQVVMELQPGKYEFEVKNKD